MKEKIKKILLGVLVFQLMLMPAFPWRANAQTSSQSFATATDFQAGTADENVEVNQSPGNVELKKNRSTYAETTKADFDNGHSNAKDLVITQTGDGELILNKGYSYTNSSIPAIADNYVNNSFLDATHNLLYISTDGGLSVINTQGTVDPADDALVITYNSHSTPSLGGDQVNSAMLNGNLLYVSMYSPLSLIVIDTKGTISASDDVSIGAYSYSSMLANRPRSSFIDNSHNLLYVSTCGGAGGGLSVIDTKGTQSLADDSLVFTYKDTTTPAIGNDCVFSASLDAVNNLLYVSTGLWNDGGGGLSVINTQGTVSPADDVLVKTYNTSSTPAIADNYVEHSFLDAAHNLLYISTYGGGLSAINTQGTVSPADDVLIKTYNTSSTPAIAGNYVSNSFLDATHNLLYVSTDGGLSVINTQGTVDPADDVLVETYNTASTPAIADNYVSNSFLDVAHNLVYVSTSRGLSVLGLGEKYNQAGSFNSQILEVASTPADTISFSPTLPEGTGASIQTRTASSDAAWVDNFDDNSTSEYVGDFYEWGGAFNTATESDGTMKLSNPTPNLSSSGNDQWVDFWFDTGKPEDFFPKGTKVTARVRINGNKETSSYNDYMYSNDWWDGSDGIVFGNEWQIVSFNANFEALSKIGFDVNWKAGTWNNATDSFEIDWLKFELPDTVSAWGEWSEPCSNQYGCPVADTTGKPYLQYRLNLTTSDTDITPSVNSVTLASGYADSGIYLSKVIDASRTADWQAFSAEQTLPLGTNITYQTRSGQTSLPDDSWSAWQATTGNNIDSANSRYLQFQATLTTTDENQTPALSALSVDYELTQQKIISEPTIEKLTDAFAQGFITMDGNDPTNTENFTFTADTILTTGDSSITFPANTQVVRTDGGTLDLTQLTTAIIQAHIDNAAGAIKIGIPNFNLTFSQPITITLPVGNKYNEETLKVIFQRDEEDTWNDETTCVVVGGNCIFQANHATSFAAVYTPEKDNHRELNVHKVQSVATSNSITLTWKTDYATQDTVFYGSDRNLKKKKQDQQKEKSHKLTLDGLLPNTNYYFRIKSADNKDNKDSSNVHIIKTQTQTADVGMQRTLALPATENHLVTGTKQDAINQDPADRVSGGNSIPQENAPALMQPQSQAQNPSLTKNSFVWWNPLSWF